MGNEKCIQYKCLLMSVVYTMGINPLAELKQSPNFIHFFMTISSLFSMPFAGKYDFNLIIIKDEEVSTAVTAHNRYFINFRRFLRQLYSL